VIDTSNIPRDTLLTGRQLCEAYKKFNFHTTPAGLETRRVRGNGPPFRRWMKRWIRYQWGEGFDWLDAELSEPMSTTREPITEETAA
jgi:hypothetical protein